ncbi:MAG: helicase-exonuclease AddAB subunit AddA [Lachnospiraceae bacterium]|nr:helicase-exonuclease AddAB subunit AddA [Lachnospiraceae bacterium]
MERTWTYEQQQVISLQGRSLLVSAAAGSGKTAVLVERIIQKITNAKHPIDIDRLLIVTFTNAAAAEMRERIGAAIEQAVERQPGSAHLQRQQTLLHNAQITTIHSFCLYVIRNYFHRIDLDPDFRVADEGELKLLKSDVLDRVLEQYYQEARPEFLTLSETIATGKNDAPLKDTVLKLFEFAMSYPWVEEWLEGCREPYQISSMEEFASLDLAKGLLAYLKAITGQWARQMRLCQAVSMEEDGPQMYAELLGREASQMEAAADSQSYQEFYQNIQSISFGRLPAARKYAGDPLKKEQVQKLRNEVKASVKKATEQFFFQDPGQMVADMQKIRPVADMLVEVTRSFLHAFSAKKQEKNMLDFNDLEHFALKALVDEETRQPTRTAEELRRGYEEIMIDEYQDSNYVQEAILKAVSRESEGVCNIFMVGDVKQSIYRFRMARPELFMEKYCTYTQKESSRQRIDLHKNFRSRPQVLDFVNAMFYRMMKADIGNVTYDSQAALYPGACFPEGEPGMFAPRFLVVEPDGESRDKKAPELEAQAVGMEIQRLMESQQVTAQMPGTDAGGNPQPGSLRPIRYSDIVILLRSLTGWSEAFVQVLGEMGIPARAATGTGYFSAIEVQTALNLLRLLDNPRQDIPMAAVLSSPIVGLDGEGLARIRTAFPKEKFYQAAVSYAEGKAFPEKGMQQVASLSQPLQEKLAQFLQLLGKYRQKASYTPIHELLSQILEETGYQDYVYALPGGEVKRANLEMLVEKAIAYEGTSYRGLFHFIRYMEQLQKYDVDFALAEGEGAEDVVRIMSIHKSKGLEFPIVFVSGLGKMFNTQDIRERVVLHPRLGIGMDCVDISRRLRTPGLTRQLLARQTAMENTGEELRVLYVALTRAKEKLILTGVLKKAGEKLPSIQAVTAEDGFLSFLSRLNSNTFLQFLLLANSCASQPCPVTLLRQADLEKTARHDTIEEGLSRLQLLASLQQPEPEWKERIAGQLSYVYPYEEEVSMKTKVSVSELKHRAMERLLEEGELPLVSLYDVPIQTLQEELHPAVLPERERYIPAFMEGIQEKNTGAKRGTAIHRILECYDFTQPPESLPEQLETLKGNGRLDPAQLSHTYLLPLRKLLRSDLGQRLHHAARQHALYREKPFVMAKPANEVLTGCSSKEMLLIQGIIDVFFEEPDGLVLLDYKTDRVAIPQELIARYKVQLDLYQEALERAWGKKVKEKLIYSFHLGKIVPM